MLLHGLGGSHEMWQPVMPALAEAGWRDRRTPPLHSEHLASTIPNASLLRFPEGAHVPHLESPRAFVEAVTAFVARVQE